MFWRTDAPTLRMPQVLMLSVLLAVPLLILAQTDYTVIRPSQVGMTESFHGTGPDYDDAHIRMFHYSPTNTLQVISYTDLDSYSTYDQEPDITEVVYEFQGFVQQLPDALVFRVPSPRGSVYQYRELKVNSQAYVLEDLYYGHGVQPIVEKHFYYEYNSQNKLVRKVCRCETGTMFAEELYELDALGRRLGETHRSSADSLNWSQTKTLSYTYSGDQITVFRDFEKYAPYTPIDYPVAFYGFDLPPYLNNDWVLSSYTVDNGVEPVTYNYQSFYQGVPGSGTSLWFGVLNFRTDALGLMTEIGGIGWQEVWQSNIFAWEAQVVANQDDYLEGPDLDLVCYPNPFSQSSTLVVKAPSGQLVEGGIFNLRGQLIRSLESFKSPDGEEILNWDGRDNLAQSVASGIYIVRLVSAGEVLCKRIVLTK